MNEYKFTYVDGMYISYRPSSVTKPTPQKDVDPFYGEPIAIYELDTQDVYMYNYETSQWVKQ